MDIGTHLRLTYVCVYCNTADNKCIMMCICLINNNAMQHDFNTIKLKATKVIVKCKEATGWHFKSILQSYKCNAS